MLVQHDRRELKDTGVSPVCVSPGDPWAHLAPHDVSDDTPNSQWEGKPENEDSQKGETPVAVVSRVAFGCGKTSDMLSFLHEDTNGEDWK